MCDPFAIVEPCDAADGAAAGVFHPFALLAAASGKLPLCLAGEHEGLVAVELSVLVHEVVEAFEEELAVEPADVFHGAFDVADKETRVFAHDGFPELLCHLGLANVEVFDGDALDGVFVALGFRQLFVGGAHAEGAALHLDHLERYLADFEDRLLGSAVECGEGEQCDIKNLTHNC